MGLLIRRQVVGVHLEAAGRPAEHDPVDLLFTLHERDGTGGVHAVGVERVSLGQPAPGFGLDLGEEAERGDGVGHGPEPVDGLVNVERSESLGGGEAVGLEQLGHGHLRVRESHQLGGQRLQRLVDDGVRVGHAGVDHGVMDLGDVGQPHHAVLVERGNVKRGVMEDQHTGARDQLSGGVGVVVPARGVQEDRDRPVRGLPRCGEALEREGVRAEAHGLGVHGDDGPGREDVHGVPRGLAGGQPRRDVWVIRVMVGDHHAGELVDVRGHPAARGDLQLGSGRSLGGLGSERVGLGHAVLSGWWDIEQFLRDTVTLFFPHRSLRVELIHQEILRSGVLAHVDVSAASGPFPVQIPRLGGIEMSCGISRCTRVWRVAIDHRSGEVGGQVEIKHRHRAELNMVSEHPRFG